ncbi:unnamed protein product, partial [Anisakis simplex]|uniref:Testis-specific serine/threonine-protein kinase 3 (inferred by orthology to a human protein) n=1 Tax=Anisakis simplex TaxID=6269 RepID=A0A0M3IYT3_ANISI
AGDGSAPGPAPGPAPQDCEDEVINCENCVPKCEMSQATHDENSVYSSRIMAELESNGVSCKKLIGKGTYSTVKKAWSSRHSKFVAIKIIDKRMPSRYIREFLPRELRIVPSLNHANIIKVYDIICSGPIVCLVQEYATNGDLLHRIKCKKRLNEDESRFFFRQIIEALKYLKSIRVAHRDLKCENILLDAFDNVKLCDFGFARHLNDGEFSRTFCGSRAYAAPEILRQIPYNGFSVDVWSAAVVLYIMITGVMPFNFDNPKKMLKKQMKHRLSFPKLIFLSDEVKELIYDMLNPSPTERLTYEDVLNSKWLSSAPFVMRTELIQIEQRKASSSEDQSEQNMNEYSSSWEFLQRH